jgi:hypothetical protein
MVLPGGLTVHTLGHIEFLNPKWHTKDLIFPVGYHVCPTVMPTCMHLYVAQYAWCKRMGHMQTWVQAVRETTVSGRMQSMHLHVKRGDDTGPLLCVHIGTCKKPLVSCTCPVEAWNAMNPTSKGRVGKPEEKFAKLFGLSHGEVLARLVVCPSCGLTLRSLVLNLFNITTCSSNTVVRLPQPRACPCLKLPVWCGAGIRGRSVSHKADKLSRARCAPARTHTRQHETAAEASISCRVPFSQWCEGTGREAGVHWHV